ncbi:MAG: M14 family zinc carboxypeptidase [Flavobacteriaceae bacterium]
MKKCLFLLFFIIFQVVFSQSIQEKYQRAKIYYNQSNSLSILNELGIPIDHGRNLKNDFVLSDFSVSEIEKARNAGFRVEILIEDSREYFLQQNMQNKPRNSSLLCIEDGSYRTPDNFNLGSMGGYLTYQEMLNELDQMKALYPNLITTKANISNFLTEGQPDNSTTPPIGGNGIKWVKISDNPNSSESEPQILYSAIHHAREPVSLSQLIFYMWYLLENYDSNPEIKSIVDNTELYFVPVVNPDGYLYNEKTDPNGGGFWRKNRKNGHGVDNNRNYDYYINGDPNNGVWGGEGTSTDPNSGVYAGTGPFSEVENQAMKWFVENHNFVMAFNNHAYGNLLLYPYGFTANFPTPENALFEDISAELVSKNGFNNIISSDFYPVAGDSDDFMYGTVGTHNKIYAFTPEIGSTFWPYSSQIEGICKSMMYLNLTAAKMTNNYASVSDTSSSFVLQTTNSFTFDLKRLGLNNGNITVSIAPLSTNIISVGAQVNYNNLNLLETVSGSIPYNIDTSVSTGDEISFQLIVNNGSYDQITSITKTFGSMAPVFEDSADSLANYTNNGWGITTEAFVSSPSSITDSPDSNYENNDNKTIQLSNQINLTNAFVANVQFYAKWDIQNNSDYTQFEVSTNNGTTWIAQCGKYTNEGSDNGNQPEGEPVYDGAQNEWVLEEIDLSDYIGEIINIRFKFVSDGNGNLDGFYFDDLTINAVGDVILPVIDFNLSGFNIYPNPVKNFLTINTSSSNYFVEIYNIQGQLINEIDTVSETQTVDYSGYSRGIYLMRITSENATKTFKIVKE